MKYYLVLVLLLITSINYAQHTLSGKIIGSDSTQLENVNILAFPENEEVNMAFATSKANGDFLISLQKKQTYKITLSHIGYVTLNDTLVVNTKNITKNFIMLLDKNELSEVIINYTPDVKVRKDTITYNVEKFVNGRERKLREVLKKLPGVTVDKDGNVESQGKKVTQVLVENKKFFNGNTKMAVNNIPAEVIKEVEIIDDYHETAFMKGLENSEEIALNINLQEDKKNFIFGNLEAGSGIDERYVLHPSIFKYGTKATYNIIGDLNNTDEKSFTIKDLIDFEGGFNKETFSNVFNSGLAQFLRTQKFNANQHKFGALNVQFNPNKKNEFRVFAIAMADKSHFKTTTTNNYLEQNTTEFSNTNSKDNLNAVFSKIHYKFTGKNNTKLKIETGLDLSDLKRNLDNQTLFSTNNFNYTTLKESIENKLTTTIDYKNKFNRHNTLTAKINYNYLKNNTINNWLSESNLFNNNIPIENSLFYNIVNPNKNREHVINTKLKYYWIINRKTHLNFGAEHQYLTTSLDFNNYQLLDNNSLNNFENFDNRSKNTLNTLGFYIELKKIFGDFLLETKLTSQQNNWKSEQTPINFKNSKYFLLPEIVLTWEPNNKKELKIRYKNESRFFNFRNSVLNNQIRSFNSLFTGNSNLPMGKYETLSINYKNYKTYSISYYPSFTYRKRTKQIVNKTLINSIYSFNTPTALKTPNESFYFRLKTKYNKKYFNIGLTPSYEIFNYKSVINNNEINNKNLFFSTTLNFETHFEENVNYDFSLAYKNRINKSNNLKSIVNSTNLYLALSYQLNNWFFKTNTSQTYFNSKNIINSETSFNTINFSILYHKEDNPWSFELKGKNILNNKSNINSSFNGIYLAQEETFIFPRYALFSVFYKL